jgi:dolichol-phosphate mannosyltransferase
MANHYYEENNTMNTWQDILIVIPTLSPSTQLLDYIDELLASGFSNILLINDGSSKHYDAIFKSIENNPHCTILTHAVNLGKGRALKTGINFYLNLPSNQRGTGIITVDSDGQHTAKDVVAVANELYNHPDSLILGCRDFSKNSTANIPWKSCFGNRTTTVVFQLLFGKRINDTQTGLRGIPESMMPALMELDGERFEYETNMLIHTVKNQIPVLEVTIDTIYVNNNSETHFHPIHDSYKIYRLMFATFFRYTISSLSSFVIDIALFQLFILLLHGLESGVRISCATLVARICSSLFNFFVNKTFVFNEKSSGYSVLLRYYSLCIIQMLVSAGLVWGIYTIFPISESLIKIVVDTLLFLVSFQVQQKWVFQK